MVSVSRRMDDNVRQFRLPPASEMVQLDSVTADILGSGIWTMYALTSPLELNKERIKAVAHNLALWVMQRQGLDQAPEVAVRNCGGLSSSDGAKRSILVRVLWIKKRTTVAYFLISCAATANYCLVLYKGPPTTVNIMIGFLWQYFHCRAKPLPLPAPELALFLAFWVRVLDGSATSETKISLSVKHSTIASMKLELTALLSQAVDCMKKLNVSTNITEDDAENLLKKLYHRFGNVMPLDYSAFLLKSVHVPVGAVECSGKVRFFSRGAQGDVVMYLTSLAHDDSL